jgi:hypothetical protein
MTDTPTTPAVQPVRCWAIVDKNGNIFKEHLYEYEFEWKEKFDRLRPHSAPHRVIRVEIKEVEDGD